MTPFKNSGQITSPEGREAPILPFASPVAVNFQKVYAAIQLGHHHPVADDLYRRRPYAVGVLVQTLQKINQNQSCAN
jgi:hypothetical protein